jgi:hypothetical protein
MYGLETADSLLYRTCRDLILFRPTCSSLFSLLSVGALLAYAQQVSQDPGVYGPALETVPHLYCDGLPTGTALGGLSRRG